MPLHLTLAAASSDFGEGLSLNAFEIVLVAACFVFFVLLILAYGTALLGKIFARMPVPEPSSPAPAQKAAVPGNQTALSADPVKGFGIEVDDPHYIAVISAAIHCLMNGRRHRIVSVRSDNSSWAAEGRRQIFSSHKVR
jgi:Na+-transporting methylmalonyl-CoA/oxaloacetate decarboxylase gamma subunit